MARRIAVTVVTLITILLATVAVPLGLVTASQDRHDFQDETITAVATLSSVAEEHLDDHAGGVTLARAITELARDGEQAAVYDAARSRVAGTGAVAGMSGQALSRALAGSATSGYPSADRFLVVSPVLGDRGGRLGAVALSVSAEPLDHQLAVLWTWLAAVSAGGLVAAALIATGLARWVGRPLGALEAAAQRLGDGQLDTRSPADGGPREVRRLAANFNQMAARLETLVDGHQAMIADVSHQLRTPLAALRLRLDVLALQPPADSQELAGPEEELAGPEEELAGAQEEVARLSRMVDGLLAVARAENVTSAPVSVSVTSVIRDRAAAWRPAAEEKSVTLEAVIFEPLTARLADGSLEQILDNLLANALEAVPAGGHIRLGAQPAGDRVRIIVADDGPGMSSDQQRAAFRRYVSATPGGTGLGLAIVHRLVTSGGGTAELSDTEGGGLTVTLDVPMAIRDRTSRRPGAAQAPGRDL